MLTAGLVVAVGAIGADTWLTASPSADTPAISAQANAPVPAAAASASVVLPSDRILTASLEILGGHQAPDIWSTPLRASVEPDGGAATLLTAERTLEERAAPERNLPAALFEPVSLVDSRQIAAISPPVPMPAAPEPEAVEPPPVERNAAREPAARAVTTASLPLPNAPPPTAPLFGRWAANAAACSPKRETAELLPLLIGAKGARAGEASCAFGRTTRPEGNSWAIAASCRNGREAWKANVKLTMVGRRLTWSSERGTQNYVRCG